MGFTVNSAQFRPILTFLLSFSDGNFRGSNEEWWYVCTTKSSMCVISCLFLTVFTYENSKGGKSLQPQKMIHLVCLYVCSKLYLTQCLLSWRNSVDGTPLGSVPKKKIERFLVLWLFQIFLGQKIESFGGAVLKVNFEGGRVKWLLDIVSLDRPLLEKESHLLPMKYPIMAVLLPLGFFTNS